MTATRVLGSATTYWNVPVTGSKMGWTVGSWKMAGLMLYDLLPPILLLHTRGALVGHGVKVIGLLLLAIVVEDEDVWCFAA